MPGNFGRVPERLQSSPNALPNSGRHGGAGHAAEQRPSGHGGQPGFGLSAGGDSASDISGSPAAAPGRTRVDPRLSDREASALPPGAWSYDAHGRPIDREGYVLDRDGTRMAADRGVYSGDRSRSEVAPQSGGYRTLEDRRPTPSSHPGRYADRGEVAPDRWPAREPAWPSEADRRYASPAPAENRRRTEPSPAEPPRSENRASRGDTNSEPESPSAASSAPEPPSGGAGGSEEASGARPRAPKTVAAQPLFNGLLLISIVANVYLAFWLKNLRHQFRELVAAKRVSSSGGSP